MIKFLSKAETLNSLKEFSLSANIPEFVIINVDEWRLKRELLISQIKKIFYNQKIIVRSSCVNEDNFQSSNAGAYKSLLNINPDQVESAINEVIASYKNKSEKDQVLVQSMLQNVFCSGVAFSHDPNTCSPYRVYNYSIGKDTTCVTSGKGGLIFQQAAKSQNKLPEPIIQVSSLMEELLNLFDNKPIDFEFAITKKDDIKQLWLLQVRPLLLINPPESDEKQAKRIELIAQKIRKGISKHPLIVGERNVYGVMPDWNPAEILGIRPKPLALSLYRELITDNIWAYQRHNYGYRNLRSFPLMQNFFGLPYIDVRLSFNSFIPSNIEDSLATRLVDYYIDKLVSEPELHDKIEFEIVHSCYTLDIEQKLSNLPNAIFSLSDKKQIAQSLKELTTNIIAPKKGLWNKDAKKIDTLNTRREILLENFEDPLDRIYWLIEDTKRYGTLPFAGLARAAFIAVQILKSFLNVGIFSQDDYDLFMSNISTIGKKLNRDRANLDRQTFLSRYGHLRPGTYDILSSRYDEKPDLYFKWSEKPLCLEKIKPFSLTLNQITEIGKYLEDHDLKIDAVNLLNFIKDAIELRELSKFHFTRNLSDVLSLIGEIGSKYNFELDDIAYCNINTFKELYVTSTDLKSLLERSIEEGKKYYEEAKKTVLPPLITQSSDAWGFALKENQPNYITQKSIKSNICFPEDINNLNGSIICIPNADPGYDWIFSHDISGLITAWGGVNSHMAIRAGELELPAVIGAGEILYKKWTSSNKLHINCAGRYVEILS